MGRYGGGETLTARVLKHPSAWDAGHYFGYLKGPGTPKTPAQVASAVSGPTSKAMSF